MKYPEFDDSLGAPSLKEIYKSTKDKLADLSDDPEELRAVADFVDYRHQKLKKKRN